MPRRPRQGTRVNKIVTMSKEEYRKIHPRRRPGNDGLPPGERKVVEYKGRQIENQWYGSPRQVKWLKYYTDPREKETYGNAYKAAIKAGYERNTAKQYAYHNKWADWMKKAVAQMRTLQTTHIRGLLEDIAMDVEGQRTADRLQAIRMLGMDQGMFVQKQITAHVGLEDALRELE